ncbi:hypothetical protein [Bradyrhizobium iriomotense]|nr:hypothetical protein [Bradyrhizobium iriomotense]
MHIRAARLQTKNEELLQRGVGTAPLNRAPTDGRANGKKESIFQLISFGRKPYQCGFSWSYALAAPCGPRRTGSLSGSRKIVTRLLAKSAEERYQTAVGVEADLRRCLAEWEVHSHIALFGSASKDMSSRFLAPERLYGREREIGALLGGARPD